MTLVDFAQMLIDRLGKAFPSAGSVWQDPESRNLLLEVDFGTATFKCRDTLVFSISGLFEEMVKNKDDEDACRKEADSFIAFLKHIWGFLKLTEISTHTLEEIRDKIRCCVAPKDVARCIKDTDFYSAEKITDRKKQRVLTPCGADLELVYYIDCDVPEDLEFLFKQGYHLVYITEEMLDAYGIRKEELREIALKNMEREFPISAFRETHNGLAGVSVYADGFMGGLTMFYPGFADAVCPLVGDSFYISAFYSDRLVLISDDALDFEKYTLAPADTIPFEKRLSKYLWHYSRKNGLQALTGRKTGARAIEGQDRKFGNTNILS